MLYGDPLKQDYSINCQLISVERVDVKEIKYFLNQAMNIKYDLNSQDVI